MMASVKAPYNECIKLLIQNIKLDPGFKDFFYWSLENNVPVVVLSSGMVPIIRALLAHMIGPDAEKIQIVANSVEYKAGKGPDDEDAWDLVFVHPESGFGHDKSRTIRPYAELSKEERPTLFYAGDGVSDLSAARETDLLFAKKGMDLVSYCVREEVPFTLFEDWTTIHKKVESIV
jgi:2,3-diketo-5-methylthio-1-phosphopentane phosphatase